MIFCMLASSKPWWHRWVVPLIQVDSRGLKGVCDVTVEFEDIGLHLFTPGSVLSVESILALLWSKMELFISKVDMLPVIKDAFMESSNF